MNEKSKHFFSIESYSIKDIEDSQLAKVELYVCHDKHNKNGSYFSIENMIKAQESIYRKPLLYRLNYFENDFLEHEDKLYAAGFVDPLFNDLRYEEKNGKVYFVISAILWKVYMSDVIEILEKDKVKGISMEIKVSNSELREDGYVEILDYTYLGIVLLGDDYPTGMFDTTAKLIFSDNKLDKMIEDSENILKYRLQKEQEYKNRMKEDINMKDLKNKETKAVEPVEVVEAEKVETFAETEEMAKKEEMAEEVKEMAETKEEMAKEEVKEEMAEEPKEKEEMAKKEEKAEYSENKEEASKDLEQMIFSLNEKVKGLELELSEKNAEIKTLAKFKADREGEIREQNVIGLFEKFSASLSKKEIEDWKEKEKTFSSFEDFEKDISKFVLDKIFENMDSEKQVFTKMHVATSVEESETETAKSIWNKIEENVKEK